MTGDGFEALLLVDQVPKSSHKKPSEKETTFLSTASGTHSQIGRPSLVSQFPSIVSTAASFVKANGFSAHERRRESIGKVGVSLREIREHLLSTVPGLKKHGISASSVARLMQPPRHGTRASLRYKGQVAARVPGKRNQYREFHTDQHYLFAQVAYRREFSVMFENECALFSCDDMNKIKVGALAVSRYHQIQRFFPVDDVPNVPDHDFPVPGYLLIPSGYMRLVKKPSPTANAMYLEGEDMTEYRDDGLNDTCTMSLATAVRTSAHEGHGQHHGHESSHHSTCQVTTVNTTTVSSTQISIHVENRPTTSQNANLHVEVHSKGNQTISLSCTTNTHGNVSMKTPEVAAHSTMKDSLGRPHFKIPHTGPTTVCLRAARFHSSTCEMHIHDMIPLIRAVVSEGKTVVTLIVDGGPDWSASSLLNALYFMWLWKACNLDMLCVTSFAARYSAYNPIEHLWSVLSKKLASVQLSAIATSDDKAPYYNSGITDEQRKAKESQVFDDAIEEIADVHWNNAVFDGFPITPVPVKCSDHFASDHDIISKFLKAPLKVIRDGSTHTVLLEQFRFLFGHVKMHHNEIVFLKCQESTCTHCTSNSVRAKEVFSFLIDRK